MLLSSCNRVGRGRVYLWSPRHRGEIVFGFATVGLDEESILHAGLERISGDAFEGRVHTWNRRSISEFFRRHGIGIRNQMPNCMRIFVRGDVAEWNNFDGFKLKFAAESKQDRVCDGSRSAPAIAAEKAHAGRKGAMKNVNILFCEPVSIQVEREAAKQDGQCKQHPLLFRHTLMWLTGK